MPPTTSSAKKQKHARLSGWSLILIFVVALTARAGWGVSRIIRGGDPHVLEFPDENDYWSSAESIANGDGLVGEHGFRALRMPLYPGLLSIFAGDRTGVLPVRVGQWTIGAAAAVFVALLGTRLGGTRVGVLSGLLVAVDPFLVFFASLLLTETVFITAECLLLLVSLPLTDRTRRVTVYRWFAVGAIAAFCIYVRESSVVLCVLLLVFLVWRRGFERSAVIGGLVAIFIVVAALSPWALRNKEVTGSWCWLTHRRGISLFDGVGPTATGASDLEAIKQMDAVRGLDEVAWNRYFVDASLRGIRNDPVRIFRLAAVKIWRTWNPVPNADAYRSKAIRLASAAWTLPVYLLSIVGVACLWKRCRSATFLLLLPALWILVTHAIFVGSVRYRLVAMPMLEILAAAGLVLLIRRTMPPDPGSTLQPYL